MACCLPTTANPLWSSEKMPVFENFAPNQHWNQEPSANPDNNTHLDKIRTEVANAPQEPTKYYGINAGLFKLGFTSDGAFNPGIDLGIVHAQAKVGLVNGADAGVRLGPIADGRAGVYAGFDQNGLHGDVRAGAQALTLAGADGEFHGRLGNATGVEANAGAHLGPIGTRAGAGTDLGPDGLDAAARGITRIGPDINAHAGANFALGYDSQVAGAAGARFGDLRGRAGAGVWTDGDQVVRPDIYISGAAGYNSGDIDIVPANSLYYGQRPCPPHGYLQDYTQGYPLGYAQSYPQAYPQDYAQAYPQGADNLPAYVPHPAAPIEVQQLPPIHEAATPENMARVDRDIRTELCNKYKVTVEKGDTYESIAARVMPGAGKDQLDAEAAKLKAANESNGYHSLHAGQKIATEDPYAIDREVRQLVAKHFGWPPPQT
jgi:LysM domain